MDKKQAQTLIKETFESPFDKNRFVGFVKNLLNDVEEATFIYKGNYIPDAYEQYINTLERIGKYTDGEHKIDILIAKLKKETSIERARTMQRNFVAWYLNGSRGGELKDAALVAFVAPNEEDWRFSLVKMDYRFEEGKSGRMRVKEEFTPARRWSFLVGVNENSHTAQSQLVDLVADDEKNPAIAQLEEAFNIEKVTKEFFEKYRELFLWTKETLDDVVKKDKKIGEDFEAKGVNTVDFSKKLLGQIVFLYFLQKKGWFGVKRDADWGTGPKNFLRELFEGKHGTYKNFFNDILEPLFYEALARERDGDFYSRFNCKIPFLNGGLFDPINNYDWVHTDILIPNDLFSNSYKTKEEDKGNGILNIFDRYNFTVKEDEPLEKEVAVDPEMLGKVFENLLEVKDRKSKGTYYTPREIVHYMCQQSLISYLSTELEGKVSKEDIETLIKLGEHLSENETIVTAKGRETSTYFYKLPESIRQNGELIDKKLVDIRVCDPAIGSGAFPVGMMSEIVKTRNVLSAYIKGKDRTTYNFKRECIEKSLCGVDIDPGAVEIAKLRLWLSLVVDEDDIRQIKPLPNLDYKIMQGNSLLEEYEGIRLFDEKLISTVDFNKEKQIEGLKEKQAELSSEYIRLHHTDKLTRDKKAQIDSELKKINNQIKKLEQSGRKVEENASLFDIYSTAKKKSDELKQLHKEFFETTQKRKKDELKKRIDRLEWDLIEATLKEQGKESQLKMIEEFKKANTKPFFLWKLHFSEIFLEKDGFDVIIANPPYVGHKGGQKKFFQEIKRTALGKMFNNERMDIFYYFFHLALNNVKQNGEIAFITTNYYVTADSAVKLRTDFKNRSGIRKLVNFNELKIFDTAQGQHNMLTFLSKQYNCSSESDIYSTNRTGLANSEILKKILNKEDKETHYYNLKQSELFEGEMNYIRLFYGTGDTQVSINALLKKVKQQGVLLSQICNLSQGIVTGLDKISRKHVLKFPSLSDQKDAGVFVVNVKEKEKIGDSPLLKPWFKNSDIDKYKPNEKNNQWVVHLNAEIKLDSFPNIKRHLLKFKEVIESRNYDSGELSKAKKLNAWWALSSSRKEFDFTLPKIISPQRSYRNIFAYTEKEWVASADVYFITSKDKAFSLKYILALLNSNLYFLWLYFRGKRKGDMLELYLTPLSEVPIKEIPLSQQQAYISLIDRILMIKRDKNYLEDSSKEKQVKEYEQQIDQMVYELYELTKEEIKIVTDFNKN